jgi:SMODS-associated and fused to various effectors sensor domain
MLEKVLSRNISAGVERELWGRAAGRCQFDGCNRPLYKSPVTQESVNISEKAHIYAFSKHGPRGRGELANNVKALNEVENLILVCHDCHRTIDQNPDGGRYTVNVVRQFKADHERRIAIVAGIHADKKSAVILYGANVGDEASPLRPMQAYGAMFPSFYPANEQPISLNMTWEGKDDDGEYWATEVKNLVASFEKRVRSEMDSGTHFSVFALAPIPLLVKLGTLLTDMTPCRVHQLQREPAPSWAWTNADIDTQFTLSEPSSFDQPPALVIALSATIAPSRVTGSLGHDTSIWQITIDSPQNDFLKTETQLSRFREIVRKAMVRIAERHGQTTPLSIFPAIPVAAAIELGRVRMPKADMPWVLYDQNNKAGAFVKALTIGER